MDARFVAIFVAFICVLAASNSEGRRTLGENILDNEVQVTVEKAWNYCKKRLKDNAEVVKALDSALSLSIAVQDGVEIGSTFYAKRIIQKAVDDLPPKEKETLLHCLKRKKISLQVLEDKQWALTNNCQNLFSGWSGFPRRYLRRLSGKRRILSIALSPGPAHPASVPSPISISPDHAPVPSSDPLQSDYDHSQSDNDYSLPSNSIHSLPDTEKISPIPSQDDNNNNNNNQHYLIAAAIATLMAALGIVTVILLVCMNRDRRVQPKDGQRDEKPLLNFSVNNLSAGSSEKSHIMGTPINMYCKNPPIDSSNPLDANYVSSQAGCQSTEAHSGALGKTVLPLPPGRTAPAAAGAGEVGVEVELVAVGSGVVGEGAATVEAAAGAVDVVGPPPEPPPPPPPNFPAQAAPPPPPRVGPRPPPPNPPIPGRPSPLGPHHRCTSTGGTSACSDESGATKTKLKPFFWDKVLANPDQSMVWHEIKAGSFQFNEEMMEALFGYVAAEKKKNENTKGSPSESPPKFVQIIDPKKSQNLAILLKALNMTTEEVCDALREGNELPSEFIHTLLKMAPTADEELKLRLYDGNISQLGPAERFLKVIANIPFAFKRLESLLFMSTFHEDLTSIKDSLETLEEACKEVRSSRLFLKLLEAVLKTGNRMNNGTYRGGAQAFKLDTLLKLSDVKGTDGKTTLLHFVVHEIIRGEGMRAARKLREKRSLSSVNTEDLLEDSSHATEEYYRNLGLQVVSGLSDELLNVKQAALIDIDALRESVSKLGQAHVRTEVFLENEMKNSEEEEFVGALMSFVNLCESDIRWLLEEDKRITALVKSTGDYFHGRAGKEEGAHLFVIVRDFLLMVDKACLDVKSSIKLPTKTPSKDVSSPSSPPMSQESSCETPRQIHQRLFPAMRERQMDDDDDDDYLNSDDES